MPGNTFRELGRTAPDVAAGLSPCPSPHWPFKAWADPRKGRVLIACEYSATVRDAFRARGFDAWSCDLLPTEGDPRWHIQGDCRDAINNPWDLIILHVPCTGMAVCGNRTYGLGKPLYFKRVEAVGWTLGTVELALSNAPYVALENPASVIFPTLRNAFNADVQYVQPWQYGHPEQKKTGLALWDLPRLTPTNDVHTEMMELPRSERERVFFMSPGPDRGKERARFFTGLAAAMADQWGDYILSVAARGHCVPAEAAAVVSFHSQGVDHDR